MADKKVDVKVVLDPGSNPPFRFESEDLPIGRENRIYFSNCGKLKGFEIHYELDDTANQGYRFPNNLDDALWVRQSGGCPTTASTWPVFKAEEVMNGGRTLVVKNTNKNVEEFFYSLRVTNGSNWILLDPGGTNQNGGAPLIEYLAGPVVAGAVCALGGAMLANNLVEPTSTLILGIGGAIVGLIVGFLFSRF